MWSVVKYMSTMIRRPGIINSLTLPLLQAWQKFTSDNIDRINAAITSGDGISGSWTPSLALTSGTVTYSDQIGSYTKVGNMVCVAFDITISAKASPINTALTIGVLPFVASSTAPTLAFAAMSVNGTLTGQLMGQVVGGTNVIQLFASNGGTVSSVSAATFLGAVPLSIRSTFCYFV